MSAMVKPVNLAAKPPGLDAPVASAVSQLPDRSIGAILIDSGKLSVEDAERILALQKREDLRFGDAAIQLGLVQPEDIQYALSQQFDYSYLPPGEYDLSRELVAAFAPFSKEVEALRALRSQLMLRWFSNAPQRKALAIVSTLRGEGRSFLAANLAIVFSQLGERTLLIDADMRQPRQHELFGLSNKSGLSSLLAGRSEHDEVQRIPAFRDLSVLTAGPVPPNPLELLGRPALPQLLARYTGEFDIVLIDTPAGIENADAQTVAARAGAAIVAVRQDHVRARQVDDLIGGLASANAQLIGTVLTAF
jgi:receptor protein-tyrosine kinase